MEGITPEEAAILTSAYEASAEHYTLDFQTRDPEGFVSDVKNFVYSTWCEQGCPGSKRTESRFVDFDDLGVFSGWIAYRIEKVLQQSDLSKKDLSPDQRKKLETDEIGKVAAYAIRAFQGYEDMSKRNSKERDALTASLHEYFLRV